MAAQKNMIKISKRLDASNVAEFKTEALSVLEQTPVGIIVNFSNTLFIDSAGLGSLVSILKTAAQSNKKLALVCLSPQVSQIFELTKLYRIFDIYDSLEKAEKIMNG